MTEERTFTTEELYNRLLHQKRGTILAFIQTLKEELMVWDAELQIVEKEIQDAPK